MIIYHLTNEDQWKLNQKIGFYTPGSLTKEGFIHCSTKEQILATANRRFHGDTSLVILVINTDKVETKIVFEDTSGRGEKHPHIYGKLSLSSIEHVLPLKPDNDGAFNDLPIEITN